MTDTKCYLSVDLGAGSGRVVAGLYNGSTLTLEEVHRFPSRAVHIMDHDYWDITQIFTDLKAGIQKAVETYGESVVSLAVDTWGVDYAYIDVQGNLIGLPYQYRDARTLGMHEEMLKRVPKSEIYEATGTQFIFLNTLNQLMSDVVNDSPQLKIVDKLLFIPDLISYWLTGVKANERTISSTSQLWNPRTGDWDRDLIARLGINADMFCNIVEPGTELGPLLPSVETEVGGKITVVAAASHDTGSAVAATPLIDERAAYVSSGTWSLMGVETPAPIISDKSLEFNFTNEAGVNGTTRVLKNICGLWLFQECHRAWNEEYDYVTMGTMAAESKPFTGMIDPDDPCFIEAGNMPDRIVDYCKTHGTSAPETKGEILRTCLEGIALKYRHVIQMLEELTGETISALHVVGGGSQNKLLCQLAADAINRPVIAGPVEATSCGNIITQLMADNQVSTLEEGREIIKRSFDVITYNPVNPETWDEIDTAKTKR